MFYSLHCEGCEGLWDSVSGVLIHDKQLLDRDLSSCEEYEWKIWTISGVIIHSTSFFLKDKSSIIWLYRDRMFVIYSLLCMNLRYNSQYYEDSKSDGLIKPSLLTPYNACPHSEQYFAPLIFRYPQFVQNTIPLISKFRVVKEFRFLSTSSAISSALSSSLDCCTIPQICVISTGQKNSIEW